MQFDALKYFESVRDAVRDLPAVREHRDSLFGLSERRGQGCKGGVSDGGMARVADRLVRLDKRVDEMERLIAEATDVIAGVGAAMGDKYATALRAHYLSRMSWREAGLLMGYSRDTARRLGYVAVDYVQTVGLAGAIEGRPLPTSRDADEGQIGRDS